MKLEYTDKLNDDYVDGDNEDEDNDTDEDDYIYFPRGFFLYCQEHRPRETYTITQKRKALTV